MQHAITEVEKNQELGEEQTAAQLSQRGREILQVLTHNDKVTAENIYHALCSPTKSRLNRENVGKKAIWDYDLKLWFFEHKKEAEIIAEKFSKEGKKFTVKPLPSKIVDGLLHGSKKQKKIIRERCKYEIELLEYNEAEKHFVQDLETHKIDRSILDGDKPDELDEKTFNSLKAKCEAQKEEKIRLDNWRVKLEEVDLKIDPKKPVDNTYSVGNYYVNDKGLYYIPPLKEGDNQSQNDIWICTPIWPEAYLRDKENKNHTLLIKIHDGEKEHKIALPRRTIAKWAELSEILLDLGQSVPTLPANQKHLQNFLMQARPNKLMRCVDKPGWHEGQYISHDGEVIGLIEGEEDIYYLSNDKPKGLSQKGSHDEWLNNCWALCANNSRLIFSVGVALASSCMYLTGEDSGGFNFVGKSSIGKSRCLAMAISVFGSPDFKRSWKNTSNGFEALCHLHNDILLPMDEGGQADPKEVGENIYMFSQGMGKGRMYKDTSARDSKDWRSMMLSTAELSLSNLMREGKKKTKAGQLVRIVDLPGAVKGAFGCFENLHGFENGVDGEEFAKKIQLVCSQYYGTAGKEFIRAITEYGIGDAKEDLNNISNDFSSDVARNFDGQVKRVANRFGLVFAALSLAIRLGVLGGAVTTEMAKEAVKKCFLDWLDNRGTTGNLEDFNLVQHVVGLIHENSDSKFKDISEFSKDDKIRNTLWGYRDEESFLVSCRAYKEHLCGDVDPTEAKEILIKEGILDPNLAGGQKKVNGVNTRWYKFNLGSPSET